MSSAHYPGEPSSVAKARASVAGSLSQATDDLRDRAVLITSELATNAVLHAGTDFTVTATIADGEVQVAVTDRGGIVPLPRQPVQSEPHGRGLVIADALADHWGVDSGPHSTTVWFTLALRPTEQPPRMW